MSRIVLALVMVALAATPVAAAGTRQLEVYLHPLGGPVHVQPERLEANVGDRLVLSVANYDSFQNGTAHDLVFCEGAAKDADRCATPLARTGVIPFEGFEVIELELRKPGTFDYFCEAGCPRSFRNPAQGIGAGQLVVGGEALDKEETPFPAALALAALAGLGLARRRTR